MIGKHDIIMQCGKVRMVGDISNNPRIYEVDRCHRYRTKNGSYFKYDCRYVENGNSKSKHLSINEIKPIYEKKDLDILIAHKNKRSQLEIAVINKVIDKLGQLFS